MYCERSLALGHCELNGYWLEIKLQTLQLYQHKSMNSKQRHNFLIHLRTSSSVIADHRMPLGGGGAFVSARVR